uniref:Uncharacterized protein n=1 Tax=Rhizophora mucronata TaxID=61149 RepID=A0A2P2QU93_RHIMU
MKLFLVKVRVKVLQQSYNDAMAGIVEVPNGFGRVNKGKSQTYLDGIMEMAFDVLEKGTKRL